METTWNKEYYDILNFYYWEPQHLGKKNHPESSVKTLADSEKKLRNMEVTLNHIFNIFIRLCPKVILGEILGKITGDFGLENVVYQSRDDVHNTYGKNVTQADMMLLDDSNVVAVEMKIGAKTSLDQLVKYAMLFHFEKEHSHKNKKHHLIYLTKSKFPKIFEEKINDIEDLTSRFDTSLIPDKTKSGSVELHKNKEEIVDILKNMNLYFITYTDFYNILNVIRDGIDIENKYSDMLITLICGITNELEDRKLI